MASTPDYGEAENPTGAIDPKAQDGATFFAALSGTIGIALMCFEPARQQRSVLRADFC
jgi:hypothetical protein